MTAEESEEGRMLQRPNWRVLRLTPIKDIVLQEGQYDGSDV